MKHTAALQAWTLPAAIAVLLVACQPATPPTEAQTPVEAQATADTSKQPAMSTDQPTPVATPAAPAAPVAPAPGAFVDRSWKVKESSAGEPGTVYAFLGDGTLIVDSPNGTPMVGKWTFEKGALTMVEEGIAYPTDILHLDANEFRLRSNNPGEPVLITLVPAPDVPLPTKP